MPLFLDELSSPAAHKTLLKQRKARIQCRLQGMELRFDSRGQILHELSLSLPHTRPLTAELEVRFARLDNTNRMLRIGGRFVDLERKQERLLAQFLAEQQRKLRRHGPR